MSIHYDLRLPCLSCDAGDNAVQDLSGSCEQVDGFSYHVLCDSCADCCESAIEDILTGFSFEWCGHAH